MSAVAAADVTRHEQADGTVVYYRDADHSYWQTVDERGCHGRVSGISTVAKCDGDTYNDPLLDWAARLTLEGIADGVTEQELALRVLRDPLLLAAELEAQELTWRHVRARAGKRGWTAHNIVERLVAGEPVAAVTGYDEAVIRWWEETNPKPLQSEHVVYHRARGFAGRFDLRYTGPVMPTGITLLDVKTGGYAANSWAIQLSLYEMAIRDSGLGQSDELVILKVAEDGTFEAIRIPYRPDWALHALWSYRDGAEIKSVIRQEINR